MWNRVACNPNYEDFLKEKETKRLVKSLQGIKSIVDTSGPKKVRHLKKRSKKAQLREARQEEINFTNQILMSKMFSIDSRVNSKRNSTHKQSSHSLNKNSRSKNNVRINEENMKILGRLQQAQPALSLHKWEKEEKNWISIRNNIIKKNKYTRARSSLESENNDLVMKILKRRSSRPTTALSSEH